MESVDLLVESAAQNGGWGFEAGAEAADADSTGLVLQALGAAGMSKHDAPVRSGLSALRALSPVPEEIADPAAAGLPRVAASDAWSRRILGAQLASWAELRHDTLLYAKQSYTGGIGCAYPTPTSSPAPLSGPPSRASRG